MQFLRATSKISNSFGAGVCGGAIGSYFFQNHYNAKQEKNLEQKIITSIQPALNEIKKHQEKLSQEQDLKIAAIQADVSGYSEKSTETQPYRDLIT